MEELVVSFDHSFRASQKFSDNANWLGGGKPLQGSSTTTPCSFNVRVPANPNHPPPGTSTPTAPLRIPTSVPG